MKTSKMEWIEVVDTYCDVCGRHCNGRSRSIASLVHSCGKWWPEKRVTCDDILMNQYKAGTTLGRIPNEQQNSSTAG